MNLMLEKFASELFCFRHFVKPDKWLFLSYYIHSFDFRHDYLKIYDGDSDTSDMLGNAGKSYCGYSLPGSQISSSNHLFIHFHSDMLGTETGFKLEYNATSKNSYKRDNCEIVIVFPDC